jgi:hypothetical protein
MKEISMSNLIDAINKARVAEERHEDLREALNDGWLNLENEAKEAHIAVCQATTKVFEMGCHSKEEALALVEFITDKMIEEMVHFKFCIMPSWFERTWCGAPDSPVQKNRQLRPWDRLAAA